MEFEGRQVRFSRESKGQLPIDFLLVLFLSARLVEAVEDEYIDLQAMEQRDSMSILQGKTQHTTFGKFSKV